LSKASRPKSAPVSSVGGDPPDSARKLAIAVSEFVEEYLGKPRFPRAPKVIHDAIWGTQSLYENEIAILDTPLLQRLRQLHQTGFTYLTYPSVTHTRFDHTLGVLYQADRLARALFDKYEERNSRTNPMARETIRHLRVAALLHDCSHGPFSHTSEEYFKEFPEIQAYVGPGNGNFVGSSASEVLAHLIISSEPFKRFLGELEQRAPVPKASWLSEMITGQLRRTEPMNAHYGEILNGPFDADKLDYIFRDGHYSGLPLGVDLDRIWLKTEIHTIKPGDLPKKVRTFSKPMRRLVMARPGINSLEQIVSARMNLTAGLYHHHKIRACDCMLKGVFLFCRENGVKLCGRRIETAADFLHFTDTGILAEADRAGNKHVKEMLSNILYRRLFKRALVFSMNSFEKPEYAEESDEVKEDQNLPLVQNLIDGSLAEHRELAVEIWKRAGRPGRPEEVWLDFPKGPKFKDLIAAFVNVGSIDNPVFRMLGRFIPIEQWANQYLQQKWRGHVFCRPEYISRITPAAVAVFRDRYRIVFTELAWVHANLVPSTAPAAGGQRRN
jgi:HD superfamily phosphohydrolase